ncbi:hypothetical protein N431DRAFT_325267 [Stipitochalara longipes BDJ]|nr:hypothetical protein N431DRAFT_325267 [Stipitochalara longipes BDJ]
MEHTFAIFSLLPTELRLKVWNYAFGSFPRVIELTPSPNLDVTVRYRKWEAMASSTLTLLQVNREARYEFLPHYSSPFNPGGIEPYHPGSLLIKYETDTIYFRVGIMSYVLTPKLLWRDLCEGAEEEMKNNLKSLAGNDRFWRNMMFTNNGDRQAGFREFEHFKKLEQVIVVPSLEERLDSVYGAPRLERFEECEPRGPYEAGYLPWFGHGFGSTSRVIPVSIKLCKEIVKLDRSTVL